MKVLNIWGAPLKFEKRNQNVNQLTVNISHLSLPVELNAVVAEGASSGKELLGMADERAFAY